MPDQVDLVLESWNASDS